MAYLSYGSPTRQDSHQGLFRQYICRRAHPHARTIVERRKNKEREEKSKESRNKRGIKQKEKEKKIVVE